MERGTRNSNCTACCSTATAAALSAVGDAEVRAHSPGSQTPGASCSEYLSSSTKESCTAALDELAQKSNAELPSTHRSRCGIPVFAVVDASARMAKRTAGQVRARRALQANAAGAAGAAEPAQQRRNRCGWDRGAGRHSGRMSKSDPLYSRIQYRSDEDVRGRTCTGQRCLCWQSCRCATDGAPLLLDLLLGGRRGARRSVRKGKMPAALSLQWPVLLVLALSTFSVTGEARSLCSSGETLLHGTKSPPATWHVSSFGRDTSSCGSGAGAAACATLAAVVRKGAAALEGSTVVIEPATEPYACPDALVRANITIQSSSMRQNAVFDCGGTRRWVEFHGERSSTVVVVQGVEIRRCFTTEAGGCIRALDVASFSVIHSAFSECYAASGGGCISVYYGLGAVGTRALFQSVSVANVVSGPNMTDVASGAVSLWYATQAQNSSVVFSGDTFCRNASATAGGGGCVSVLYGSSSIDGVLSFGGNTSMTQCSSQGVGGCVSVVYRGSASSSLISFSGNTSMVHCSSRGNGGCVSAYYTGNSNNSILSFSGSTSMSQCSAVLYGGCVSAYYASNASNSAVSLSGDSKMSHCSTSQCGGCVSVYYVGGAYNSISSFRGSTRMSNCSCAQSGGCVSVRYGGISARSVTSFSGSTDMSDCASSSGVGACVSVWYWDHAANSSTSFSGNTSVSNCRAAQGENGCVSVWYWGNTTNSASLFHGTTRMANCTGAACVSAVYGSNSNDSMLSFSGSSAMTHCTRGCVSLWSWGDSTKSMLSFSGTTDLSNCSARACVSAMYYGTSNGSALLFSGNTSAVDCIGSGCVLLYHGGNSTDSVSSFRGTTSMLRCLSAHDGGCVAAKYSSANNNILSFSGSTSLSNCSSAKYGGCVSAYYYYGDANDSVVSFGGETSMSHCSSAADGGCVSVRYYGNARNSMSSFSGTTSLMNCSSAQDGGCLSLAWIGNTASGVQVLIANTTVRDSVSSERGGAFALTSLSEYAESINFVLANVFIERAETVSASSYGGAISIQCAADEPRMTGFGQTEAQWTRSCSAVMENVTLLHVQSVFGGGIHADNGMHRYSHIVVTSAMAQRSGGALEVGGSAVLECDRCVFRDCMSNAGRASAVSMASKGSLTLGNARIHPAAQTASIVEALVAVNVNVSSLSVSCPEGYLYAETNGTLTQASFPWIRTSPECCVYQSYQSTCTACAQNEYALIGGSTSQPKVACLATPYGAQSAGGANITPRPGYWGTPYPTADEITMYFCPEGYCCPGPATCSPVSYCSGNRAGILCGSCSAGFSQLYSAVGCAPDDACGQTWYYPLAILFALVVALYFLYWKGASTSGRTGSLISFYQLVPFFLVSVSETDLWERAMADFFNLRVPYSHAGGGSETGLCPIVGLTAVGKVLLHLFVPVLLSLILIVLYLVETRGLRRKGSTERFAVASLLLVMLAYVSVLESTFSLLHCVPVKGEKRLFLSGDVTCYQPWQVFLFFVVIALYAFPFALLWWQRSNSRKLPRRVRIALQGKYRDGCAYWETALLLRRLLVVSVFVFEVNVFTRMMVLTVISVAYLLIHTIVKPYVCRLTNTFEGLMHFELTLIAVINVRNAGFVEDATIPEGPSAATTDQLVSLQSVLVLVPLILYCSCAAYKYGRQWVRRYLARSSPHIDEDAEARPLPSGVQPWTEMSEALLR